MEPVRREHQETVEEEEEEEEETLQSCPRKRKHEQHGEASALGKNNIPIPHSMVVEPRPEEETTVRLSVVDTIQ